MGESVWLAIAAAALGTWLMRALPLLWMQRRLGENGEGDGVETLPGWLGVLGPLMIAAMLGVSLVPSVSTVAAWLGTVSGVIATLLVWRRTRTLGSPVLVGVLAYGGVILLSTALH